MYLEQSLSRVLFWHLRLLERAKLILLQLSYRIGVFHVAVPVETVEFNVFDNFPGILFVFRKSVVLTLLFYFYGVIMCVGYRGLYEKTICFLDSWCSVMGVLDLSSSLRAVLSMRLSFRTSSFSDLAILPKMQSSKVLIFLSLCWYSEERRFCFILRSLL